MTELDRRVVRVSLPQRVQQVLCYALLTGAALLAACAATPTRPGQETHPEAQSDVNLEQRLRELQQAEALYLSGRYPEAQKSFEVLTRAYPKNPEVWFRLGNTLMKQRQYDDAAAALQSAISLDPSNGRAALNLALCRLAQAQSAAQAAQARFAAGTAERQQADAMSRYLTTFFAGSESPK